MRSRENALFASEAEYRAAIDQCAAEGIKLEMTHIQIPESITLGLVDERDADIEQICRCIEAAGRAGLRGLNYNFLVGAAYARTEEYEESIGRGGSSYSQFDLDRYDNSPPELVDGVWSNGGAGVVSREEVYERAKYFLEGVIPTAEKWNVQMACHLNDPPAPVLRGVEQWNYPVFEGIRRFSELVDSPMHGFNCKCSRSLCVFCRSPKKAAAQFAAARRRRASRIQASSFTRSWSTSASASSSSTSTSGTSRAGCTTSRKSGRTRATST